MSSKVMHTPREVQSGYEYRTRTVKRAVMETVGSRFDSCLCDKIGSLMSRIEIMVAWLNGLQCHPVTVRGASSSLVVTALVKIKY